MRFSVIVPVYNTASYLPLAIDSVLANDTSSAEVIIVDDGSTDSLCPAICDGYAERHPDLVRVIHQENRGLGGARNSGLEAARGDYVIFLDSDDELAPDALARLAAAIDEAEADVIIFGMAKLLPDGTRRPVEDIHLPAGTFTAESVPEVLTSLPGACNKAWRRELFSSSGISFPPRALYEDLRTTPKLLALSGSAAAIGDHLYLYREREGSIMSSASLSRAHEIIDAFDDLLRWFSRRSLSERYAAELEKLSIDHLLIAATVRVARCDPRSPLLLRLREYMQKHFPGYRSNPYISSLPRRRRLILRLAEHKRYRLIKLIFDLKG